MTANELKFAEYLIGENFGIQGLLIALKNIKTADESSELEKLSLIEVIEDCKNRAIDFEYVSIF